MTRIINVYSLSFAAIAGLAISPLMAQDQSGRVHGKSKPVATSRQTSAVKRPIAQSPSTKIQQSSHQHLVDQTHPANPPTVKSVLSSDRIWTLESLESLALQNNPTLAMAAATFDADQGVYDQVGRYPNPQIGYLRSDNSRSDQSQTQGVFVSQEFVTAGKLKKNREVEGWDLQRLSWDTEAQRMRVLNDLKIRYFELLGSQRVVELTRDLERIAADGYESAIQLKQANQASRKDVLQAKVQVNTVRLNLREAEHRYDAAWDAVSVLIGVPSLERAAVAGKLDDDITQLNWEDSWTQLENNSPQLQAALSRIQVARGGLARESVEPIPNLNLQIVAERDRVSNSNTLSALVSVPIPLFNRNQGNIQRAQAEVRQACAEVERVRLVLRDQLIESFRRYKTARDQVTSLHDEILPDAEETLSLTTQGYKQGEFGILEVLAARQTYFESSLAYVEALTELQKVTTEIQGLQLTGGLNPADVGTALQGTGGIGRQRGILNSLQENASKRLLPAAVQTGR